jgi:hypothetical protein
MILYKCLTPERLDVLTRRRIRFTQPGSAAGNSVTFTLRDWDLTRRKALDEKREEIQTQLRYWAKNRTGISIQMATGCVIQASMGRVGEFSSGGGFFLSSLGSRSLTRLDLESLSTLTH